MIRSIVQSTFERAFRGLLRLTPTNRLEDILNAHFTSVPQVQNLSDEQKLAYSVVYACIRIYAETLSCPQLYDKGENGVIRPNTDSPEGIAISSQPNPVMYPSQFWQCLGGHVAGWGNAYFEIDRQPDGTVHLWPLRPDWTRAAIRSPKNGKGWIKFLKIDFPGEKRPRILLPGEYGHVMLWSHDGINGLSPLDIAASKIFWSKALQDYSVKHFTQGDNLGQVVSYPRHWTEGKVKEFEAQLDRYQMGLDNSHRRLMLEEGVTIDRIGVPPGHSQLVEQLDKVSHIIATSFRIPGHMVGLTEGLAYKTLESQDLQFRRDVQINLAKIFEEAILISLFSQEQRGRYEVRFPLNQSDRLDSQGLRDRIQTALTGAAITVDEERLLLGLPPLGPENGGNERMMPVNYAPYEVIRQGGGNLPGQVLANSRSIERRDATLTARRRLRQRIENAIRAAFADLAEDDFERASEALDGSQDVKDVMREHWTATASARVSRILEALLPHLRQLAELLDAEFDLEEARALAREISEKWQAVGLQSLESDDLEASVLAWEDRAEKAGRSDSVFFESAFVATLLARKGRERYTWATLGENCPNCNALAGRTTRQGQPFAQRGERLPTMRLERTVYLPPLHRGCDCFII